MRRARQVRAIALQAAGSLRSGTVADAGRAFADWLRRQAAIEWDFGRVALWLAPAFALGILLQGAAARTPALWAGPLAALLAAIVARRGRAHLPVLIPASAAVAIALGFSAATIQEQAASASPVLQAPFRGTATGVVEKVEPRLRDQRVVLRVTRLGTLKPSARPDRVRVSVAKSARFEPGDSLRLTATWRPPPGPIRPGGYDAARVAFMQGIGAFGFAASDITVRRAEEVGMAAWIERLRLDLARRIAAAAGGGAAGAIAAALVTGIRGAIPVEAEDAMRNAGLTHLLSISGTHLALVAGVLFFSVRGMLALVPALALTRPIKAWAAVAALCGTSVYLVLSGAEVATQRSFLMSAVVLLAIIVGRPALTMRTIAIAAVAVLALSPATLFGASLQMSFAAVLAIVAGFEFSTRPPDEAAKPRSALRGWFGRFLLAAIATTLLAGLATAPFAAFHFHRMTPYALLGNLLALPLVSFWIMPAGVLGALLMPFGLDGTAWSLMGAGVDAMLAVARWVAALPGAEHFVPAFGAGALCCFAAALLLGSIFVSKLRLLAVPVAALGLWLAASAERPDVLIDPGGKALAVRGGDGRLTLIGAKPSSLIGRSWLEADGEPPTRAGAAAARCDAAGCTASLADGRLVALVLDVSAFAEDCRRAALVVTALTAPEGCRRFAAVVDRAVLAATGALALFARSEGFAYEPARPMGGDRPWYGRTTAAQDMARSMPRLLRPEREPPPKDGSSSELPDAAAADAGAFEPDRNF